MSKEEKSQVDLLLDENNVENLKLYDENDNETEFEQVAVIPHEGKTYAILKPVDKMVGVNDDEALVFVLDYEDEEEDEEEIEVKLVIVDDEKIIDVIFQKYHELLKEEDLFVEEDLEEEANESDEEEDEEEK